MSNKLFVGNLSFNTTENDLLDDASVAFGTVMETNLMMDRISGRPPENHPLGGGSGGRGPRREFSCAGGSGHERRY